MLERLRAALVVAAALGGGACSGAAPADVLAPIETETAPTEPALTATSRGCGEEEREPNDGRDEAVGLTSCVVGALGAGDVDMFAIEVPAGARTLRVFHDTSGPTAYHVSRQDGIGLAVIGQDDGGEGDWVVPVEAGNAYVLQLSSTWDGAPRDYLVAITFE